jgi:lipoprotein-releasing system ATP-binding protein
MSATSLMKLDRVTKTFASAEGAGELVILRELSMEIAAGETVAIVGPSGSGKSTILNLLGALDRPTSGTVWFGGRNLGGMSDDELARLRNLEIGFVFQAHHLLPQCTVWENVLVPALAEQAVTGAALEERAKRLLKRVGLEDRLGHRPAQLSGGERQRVAVVRALLMQPKLVLADEPTGALDRKSAAELSRLLLELNAEEKTTLVIVTHAPDLAAQMQRSLSLKDGSFEVRS